MSLQLDTKRLIFSPCTPDDVDGLCDLWRQPLVRRYLFDNRVLSRDEVEQFVTTFGQLQKQCGHCLWKLEARDDAALVGFTAIRAIPNTEEVEIYYGLAPQFWGQGLAGEAAAAVLRYGFDELGLPRLWARTDPPNTASMRVAERLGMQPAEDPGETSFPSFVIERDAWNESQPG